MSIKPSAAAALQSRTKKPAMPGLPVKKKKPSFNLLEYTLLLYGREKIGKTTFCASYPDAMFLSTEPGTEGQEIFEYNAEDGGCKSWQHFRNAVDLLEKTDQFKTIIVDTADRAYDLCLDWVCENLGVEYPGHDSNGKEDFGKSWKAVKQEFTEQVHRILRTGRGLVFTSHATEQEMKTRSGDKFTRIYPSVSGQARKVIEALVDLFFYLEYMKTPEGETARVIITEGDEVIWAGARQMRHALPRFIPLTAQGGFDILQAAFAGEDVGLDPKTLIPTRNASEAIKQFYQKARRVEALPVKAVAPAEKAKKIKREL